MDNVANAQHATTMTMLAIKILRSTIPSILRGETKSAIRHTHAKPDLWITQL